MDGWKCWASSESPWKAKQGVLTASARQVHFHPNNSEEDGLSLRGGHIKASSWLLGFIRLQDGGGGNMWLFTFHPLVGAVSALGFLPAYLILGTLGISPGIALLACLVVLIWGVMQKAVLPSRDLWKQLARSALLEEN